MDQRINFMKAVSILGNTNSGAGAIYEYLIGRHDTNDPFNKKEFRILNDPGGINDLYKCYDCYSLQSFNDSLNRLIKLEKAYRKNRNFFNEGLGLNQVRNYKKHWNDYIQNIKGSEYSHRYIFNDVRKSLAIIILKKILNRLGLRKIIFKKYNIGTTRRNFRDFTYEFFYKIISDYESKDNLSILNQCGNFACPVTSTALLGEPKIICVRRNPLDQYSELKLHKGMKNVSEFINWYLHCKKMESRDEFKDEKVLEINFEEFVLDYQNKTKEICNFLKIDPMVTSNYDPFISKKNIGKYKSILDKREIEIIKDKLSPWINNL